VQAALEDLRQDEDIAAMLEPPTRIELRFHFCDPFGSHDIGDKGVQLYSDQDMCSFLKGFVALQGVIWKISPHPGNVSVYLAGIDSDWQWEFAGNIVPVYESEENSRILAEWALKNFSS
jgi:hypothetical protein